MPKAEGTKVLIIETAFPGDVIISLGIAEELHRLEPDAEITYLVRPDAKPIAEASPSVSRVLIFDKRGAASGRAGLEAMAEQLNDMGFDVLILLHNSERSRSLAQRLRIPRKIGFANAGSDILTDTVPDAGWSTRYERAIVLLRALYPEANLNGIPKLRTTANEAITAFANTHASIVALAPGSAWMTKEWGDDKFYTLAASLLDRGYAIVVVGGAKEAAFGERVSELGGDDMLLDLTGKVDLLTSAEAIRRSSLLICNDSAPAHLAVAVGTPVLAVFGPTVPEFGFAPPAFAGATIGLEGLWCRPCTAHGSNECPIHTHECMRDLSTNAVLERALELLRPFTIDP